MEELGSEKLKIFFDIFSGQLLVGEAAQEAQIDAMEREGFPAEIWPLDELIDSDEKLPSFTNSLNNKYEGVPLEEFINNGRWLLKIFPLLSERRMDRLATLGIAASSTAIVSPKRFLSITNYQEAIGQEKIIWKKAFRDWDFIDVALHLRSVGLEEKTRPTDTILNRRSANGKKEPSYKILTKIMPLSEAQEFAGYPTIQTYNRQKYEELGYIFYLANGRAPHSTEMKELAKDGTCPPRSLLTHVYDGDYQKYKAAVRDTIKHRAQRQRDAIKKDFYNGLPLELTENTEDQEEIIRRVGRYRIIEKLFPNKARMFKTNLAKYDVIGSIFVGYLKMHDERIDNWLVESVARIVLFYPEIFPDGDFIKSLKVEQDSFFSGDSSEQLVNLSKLIAEHSASAKNGEDIMPIERKAICMILDGKPLTLVSREITGRQNVASLERRVLVPLRAKLGAFNNVQLARRAVGRKLVAIKPQRYTVLTLKQREILELMSYGMDRNDISLVTGLTPSSVGNYMEAINNTFKPRNRIHTIMLGYITGNLYMPGDGSYLPIEMLQNLSR